MHKSTVKKDKATSFGTITSQLSAASGIPPSPKLVKEESEQSRFIKNFIFLFLIDPAKLYAYNKQPADYEAEEPGYLSGMLKGYKTAWEKDINREINHDLLLSIHSQVLGHVAHRHPGHYKIAPNHNPILTNSNPKLKPKNCRPNASVQGIREFIKTWMIDASPNIHEMIFQFRGTAYPVLEKSFQFVSDDGRLEIISSVKRKGAPTTLLKAPYEPLRDSLRIEHALDNSGSEYLASGPMPGDFSLCYVNMMAKYSEPNDTVRFCEVMRAHLDSVFLSYNSAIKQASSVDEKLAIIAKHVQLISQIHPFEDGNTRTCYVLLNRLLMEEGLDITLLADPNRLDFFSVHEIVGLIKEGQKYVESLLLFNSVPSLEKDEYFAPFIEAKLSQSQVQPFPIRETPGGEHAFFIDLLLKESEKMLPTLDTRQIEKRTSELKAKYQLVDLSDLLLERALRKAAANNMVDDIEFLLAHFKINIDAQDTNKESQKTALFLAAERGLEQAVGTLIRLGADPSIPTAKGLTAEDTDVYKQCCHQQHAMMGSRSS